jgi:hypothetical protein
MLISRTQSVLSHDGSAVYITALRCNAYITTSNGCLYHSALRRTKLAERHAQQLSYYAQALEAICGKRPDKILIYSLPLGKALEITL